jgi:hypothetical protein
MTKPTSSAARCDRIISLIDECLADVESGLRLIAGEGHTVSPTRVPSRHLALIRS